MKIYDTITLSRRAEELFDHLSDEEAGRVVKILLNNLGRDWDIMYEEWELSPAWEIIVELYSTGYFD